MNDTVRVNVLPEFNSFSTLLVVGGTAFSYFAAAIRFSGYGRFVSFFGGISYDVVEWC